ncbi:DUF386 domain-containing protein [Lachnospiraceae bacterium]|nr:DUF386 domain-containing protein [Lachnospiraceae bacterium]
MIFGNVNHMDEFSFLDHSVKECYAYYRNHDLGAYERGSHEIDGERLFVNVVEYMTTAAENRFWEAHKKYLDVHVMLRGEEQIDVNFIWNMHLKEYVAEEDFLPMQGEKNGSVILRPGDFLICYPADGHRTAVAAGEPQTVKKAIFKVRI